MKKLLIIVSVLFLASCKNGELSEKASQQERNTLKEGVKQIVGNKEIYEVINYCLTNKDLFDPDIEYLVDGFPVSWGRDEDLLDIAKVDTIFTLADKAFMLKQKQWAPEFKIEQKWLAKKINMVSGDSLLEKIMNREYLKEVTKGMRGSISFPLFSEKRDCVLVTTGYYCGMLCAGGASHILKRTVRGWEVVYTFDEWIS